MALVEQRAKKGDEDTWGNAIKKFPEVVRDAVRPRGGG